MKFLALIAALGSLVTLSIAADPSHHAMGWKPGPPSTLRQFVHHPAYSAANLPDPIDLSGTMPNGPAAPLAIHNDSIYDQLQKGSCTAQAGKRAFEFAWHKAFGVFFNGSRQGLYTCELIHDGNWPQDVGSYTGTVVWVLTHQGLGLEQCCPYSTPVSAKLPACYLPDAKTRVVVHAYDVDNTDHVSIIVALSKGFPVIYGGLVYQSIETLNSTSYFNAVHSGLRIGGHERTILGVNKHLSHKYPNGKTVTGFYWVANSWNTTWGYRGYSWEPCVDIEDPKQNNDFAVIDVVQQVTSTH